MVKTQESSDSTVNETESVIQEYWEKIRQALEKDCNQVKEKAEREADQIIARAQEEANKAVAQAREEANVESKQIIASAKEEADQIVRKSREENVQAWQDSARILKETREKASQIVAEIIENGAAQAQSEFTRIASEAMSKTSQLLTQVNKSIEKIIGETDANIKAELERLTSVITEAEVKLQPLININDNETEVNSQRSTGEEEVKITPVAREKKEQEIPSVVEKRGAPFKDPEDHKIFKGKLKLEMIPPFDQERLESLPEWLTRLPGLRVLSTGGYSGSNRWITTYTIDLKQPQPLLKFLKDKPKVKDVAERHGNVVITLR